MIIQFLCRQCGAKFNFNIPTEDWAKYERGAKVQDCFPYLTAGERELIISQTCEKCFDKMFKEEE